MKGEILPPLTASVHVRRAGWRFGLRLWLPLFLFWLLLLPLVLLALPFLLFAALIFGVRFWGGMRAALSLLAATRGTSIAVDRPGNRIFVNLQ